MLLDRDFMLPASFTEPEIMVGTWFGEFCSCCCLPLLPQLGCSILPSVQTIISGSVCRYLHQFTCRVQGNLSRTLTPQFMIYRIYVTPSFEQHSPPHWPSRDGLQFPRRGFSLDCVAASLSPGRRRRRLRRCQNCRRDDRRRSDRAALRMLYRVNTST